MHENDWIQEIICTQHPGAIFIANTHSTRKERSSELLLPLVFTEKMVIHDVSVNDDVAIAQIYRMNSIELPR